MDLALDHAGHPPHSRILFQKVVSLTMNRPVAFFDFDGTLTRRDSLIPFLHTIRGLKLGVDLLTVSPWLGAYALRMMCNERAKKALLKQSLAGMRLDTLREHGSDFATKVIPGMLRSDTMDRLRDHQDKGHICVLVSASLDVYLEPWSQANGFSHCIASRLEIDDQGIVTGGLHGGNCYGMEKTKRISSLFHEFGIPPYIYAYGDSKADKFMMEMADESVWC